MECLDLGPAGIGLVDTVPAGTDPVDTDQADIAPTARLQRRTTAHIAVTFWRCPFLVNGHHTRFRRYSIDRNRNALHARAYALRNDDVHLIQSRESGREAAETYRSILP